MTIEETVRVLDARMRVAAAVSIAVDVAWAEARGRTAVALASFLRDLPEIGVDERISDVFRLR